MFKRFAALSLTLLMTLVGVSLSQSDNPDITILQGLSDEEDFSTLVSLLQSSGLAETLGEAGPFTVFAPHNGAFEELNPSVLAQLQSDAGLLEQVLLGHVVSGQYGINDLQDAEDGSIMSLQGEALTFDLSLGGLDVNNAELNSANVENTYSNGVVHVVGDVVIPVSLAGQLGADDTDVAEEVSDEDAEADGIMNREDYDLSGVTPMGGFESSYEAYDNDEMGAIILTQTTPGDQHANFDVVGPNDYWTHFDFTDDAGEEHVLDNLMPGVYSVAATDDGLTVSHSVVEVRAGESVRVHANMETWDEAGMMEPYDPYATWGTYEGYDTAYPGYPYGGYEVGEYEAYADMNTGAIAISGVESGTDVVVTGPNGYSNGFEADSVIENLAPGVYVIAATAEDSELFVTTVEIQGGQQLPLGFRGAMLE